MRHAEPLPIRPKAHDNTAVEAWLKENKPTVLPSFEKVAHRPIRKPETYSKIVQSRTRQVVQRLTKQGKIAPEAIKNMCNGNIEMVQEIKRCLRANYGLKLMPITSQSKVGNITSWYVGEKV